MSYGRLGLHVISTCLTTLTAAQTRNCWTRSTTENTTVARRLISSSRLVQIVFRAAASSQTSHGSVWKCWPAETVKKNYITPTTMETTHKTLQKSRKVHIIFARISCMQKLHTKLFFHCFLGNTVAKETWVAAAADRVKWAFDIPIKTHLFLHFWMVCRHSCPRCRLILFVIFTAKM